MEEHGQLLKEHGVRFDRIDERFDRLEENQESFERVVKANFDRLEKQMSDLCGHMKHALDEIKLLRIDGEVMKRSIGDLYEHQEVHDLRIKEVKARIDLLVVEEKRRA
ncbi:hypothetical protein CBW65_07030 [Tumebacillus avium]|uniref:Uncharacterized protein n=1 Tax=Tumebacillus avium TaxID=1903704 RepID=A0A1Y0ILG4_9BACL|nr:hypothetical protein CBW65_07030 [Tumebacillus avium]